jgi:hypothetical protein
MFFLYFIINDINTTSMTSTITKEEIYSYSDGTVYMGYMRPTTAEEQTQTKLSHLRHGTGTLRTPAFVYGAPLKEYTSDDAIENAHLAKWHEYIGTWENDKMHGYGIHIQKSGDGGEIVIFEGIWENGKPKKSVQSRDDDSDQYDETVFGW